MALDPKSFKNLTNAMKVLSATGEEMSKRGRDLITILVAMQQELLIQEKENIQSLFEDIAKVKFCEGSFRYQNSDIVGKQKNALNKISGIQNEVYKMDVRQISQMDTENDILNFLAN